MVRGVVANPPVKYFCNLYLIWVCFSFYLRLAWVWLSFYLHLIWVWLFFLFVHWETFDSVKRSESWWWCCRGKLLQGNRLKRQYCEELQLLPATTKHRSFRRFSCGIDFFYFEGLTGQDVLRERDDVLKFFYLTEKWNMRRPPAGGELLALPSEAWNAVHKEFQKILKTRRKNDKCSGSSRGTERRAVKKEGGLCFW